MKHPEDTESEFVVLLHRLKVLKCHAQSRRKLPVLDDVGPNG
jgi:hypothetical protein